MYTLYWDVGAASRAPHVLLAELGVPFELRRVDLDKNEQHSDWYKRVNPHARIPALSFDGQAIYETVAIMLTLTERHPDSGASVQPNDSLRPRFLQFMTYLTNTVQEALLHVVYPHYYATNEPLALDSVKLSAEQRLSTIWAFLNRELAPGPYLLGGRFSAADILLTLFAKWSGRMNPPADSFENLKRCMDLVEGRPSYQRALEREAKG